MSSIHWNHPSLLCALLLAVCALLAVPAAAAEPGVDATYGGEGCASPTVDLSLGAPLFQKPAPTSTCSAFCSSTFDCEMACPDACNVYCDGFTCKEGTGCDDPPSQCQGCRSFCRDDSECNDSCPNDCTYVCRNSVCVTP